jgi:hypothetical protein
VDEVRIIVDVDPPLFGEMLARALREPLADVDVRLSEEVGSAEHLTVVVCDETAEGGAVEHADLVVRIAEHGDAAVLASVHDRTGSSASDDVEAAFFNLSELVDLLRRVTAFPR